MCLELYGAIDIKVTRILIGQVRLSITAVRMILPESVTLRQIRLLLFFKGLFVDFGQKVSSWTHSLHRMLQITLANNH